MRANSMNKYINDDPEGIFELNRYSGWDRNNFIDNMSHYKIKLQALPFNLSGETHRYDVESQTIKSYPYSIDYHDKVFYHISLRDEHKINDQDVWALLYPVEIFQLIVDEYLNKIYKEKNIELQEVMLEEIELYVSDYVRRDRGYASVNKLADLDKIFDMAALSVIRTSLNIISKFAYGKQLILLKMLKYMCLSNRVFYKFPDLEQLEAHITDIERYFNETAHKKVNCHILK